MFERIASIMEMIAVMTCIKFLFEEKPRIRRGDVIIFAVETIIMAAIFEFNLNRIATMIFFIIFFLYIQVEYQGNFRRNLINYVLCVAIVGLGQLIIAMLLTWLSNFYKDEFVIVFINICCISFVFVLGKFGFLYKISKYLLKFESIVFIVISLLFCATVYLIFLYKQDNYFRLTDFLFFGVWSVILCYLVIQWKRMQLDNLAKSRELEMKEIYESGYQNLLNSVRKRQHDFDNQLNALRSQHLYAKSLDELIESQKKYSEVVLYENRYNKLIVKGGGSPILTGFFFSKLLEAEMRGCDVRYNVSYDKMECALATYHFVDIFGVLFDNAIEALETYEKEKTLCLEVLEYADRIHCGLRNASPYISSADIRRVIRENKSEKGEGRGLGLSKVVEILNLHDIDLLIYNKQEAEINFLSFEFEVGK